MVELEFERTGGFAGTYIEAKLDVDKLDPKMLSRLRALFREEPIVDSGIDRFSYLLRLDGKTVSIGEPSPYDDLMCYLTDEAIDQKRRQAAMG